MNRKGAAVLARMVLALSVLTGLAACGEGEPPSSPAGTPRGEPTQPTELPTLKPPTKPPTTPTDVFKPVTVTGTIQQGPGDCLTLVTDQNIRYALLGGRATSLRIEPGSTVTLRGMPSPQVQTHCEGIPLRVYTLSP
jgi:hypothetical protein